MNQIMPNIDSKTVFEYSAFGQERAGRSYKPKKMLMMRVQVSYIILKRAV